MGTQCEAGAKRRYGQTSKPRGNTLLLALTFLTLVFEALSLRRLLSKEFKIGIEAKKLLHFTCSSYTIL